MKQEFLKYLSQLISFKSTAESPAEKLKCLNWIQQNFFSKSKYPVIRGTEADAPYLYLKHPRPRLLWFAHIDVVPGQDDQFSLKIKGDKIYGRGTKDMKGPALTLLMAYKKALREGTDPPVSILLTSDEETAGHSVPLLLKKKIIKAPAAYTPDNSTKDHIIVKHKGALWAELSVSGKGGHSALPWGSHNPIPQLAEAIIKVTNKYPPGQEKDWQITVTPTRLSGGNASNQIPCTASCTLDIRFPPELSDDPDEVLKQVRKNLPENCRLMKITGTGPLQTDPADGQVKLLQRTASFVLKKSVIIGRDHGASDARYFNRFNIPAFIYGPIGGDLHGANEWVSLKSLLQHIEINFLVLKELSQ